jgi:hypothetical protein
MNSQIWGAKSKNCIDWLSLFINPAKRYGKGVVHSKRFFADRCSTNANIDWNNANSQGIWFQKPKNSIKFPVQVKLWFLRVLNHMRQRSYFLVWKTGSCFLELGVVCVSGVGWCLFSVVCMRGGQKICSFFMNNLAKGLLFRIFAWSGRARSWNFGRAPAANYSVFTHKKRPGSEQSVRPTASHIADTRADNGSLCRCSMNNGLLYINYTHPYSRGK